MTGRVGNGSAIFHAFKSIKWSDMKNDFTRYTHLKLFVAVILLVLWCFAATASGSESSVIAPLSNRSLLLDAQRIGDNLIAVGERGHILLSEDSGTSWKQMPVPTRATLTAIYFIDRQNGWVVGHDQVILRTKDSGKSWQLVYENAEAESPLLDVFFLDSKHGYAIGAYGQFLESFDGGSSWKGRWIGEDDFHLNQMIAMGDHLFIAAEAGFAYRSEDDGQNWILLESGYHGSFFGVFPAEENRLLLFGLRGHLFRSDSAGESWSQVETGTEASLTSGLRLEDGTLVITGLAGALLTSQDNGNSFVLHQDPDRKGFSKLLQAADGSIVAVGDFGVTKLSPESIRQ
ncbi:MAG: YCF48-related protein [Thermodesulfobacteriota bacterium]|nr:YCF48-related protein [Thermodesulfobacteriota bacterium]